LPVEVKGIPFSSFDAFGESLLLRQLDPQCFEHFDDSLYRELDLMIGVAFHSVLFAVQAAIPVIAIDCTPKVRHFMEDSGLTHYLLGPHEHQKLLALVAEVLANRSDVAAELHAIRLSLHREAVLNVGSVREQIERSRPRYRRMGPKVTVAVMGSGSLEKDQRTLASCRSQTYDNTDLLLISTDPQATAGARLQQALAQSSGEYLTWIDGGDWFARDALDCLVSRLDQAHKVDVVYADYYPMDEANLPIGYHSVPDPKKLFRRDVVGPCFLMRRTLLGMLGQHAPSVAMLAYELWLQINSSKRFAPFHAPLFYSARPIKSQAFVAQERETRRRWLHTKPAMVRVLWRAIDTNLGERLVMKPLARIYRLINRRSHADRD
jgi:hypothetical protein